MNAYIRLHDPSHGVKHYVGLSAKTVSLYLFYLCFVFSIPAAKFISAQILEAQVGHAVIGETAITVSIADTDEARIRGLSGQTTLPPRHGLLFIFDENDYHGVWMKDVNFAVDILWLNQHSEVIHIQKNVSPDTYPTVYKPRVPARLVLELNAGFVDKYHLKIGDRFVLP